MQYLCVRAQHAHVETRNLILASVPSFRLWGSGNIKNQSCLLPGKHCREDLWKTSAKTTPFGNHPLANHREKASFCLVVPPQNSFLRTPSSRTLLRTLPPSRARCKRPKSPSRKQARILRILLTRRVVARPHLVCTLLRAYSLLAFSLLIIEDCSFPSDRNVFSTFVGGYKNIAIAERKERKISRNPH